MPNYSNCAIVVFGSIEERGKGEELQKALGDLGSQFAGTSSNDIVYVSAQGVTLTVQAEPWNLALVWDYGGSKSSRLNGIGKMLRPRLQEVIKEGGFAAIVQHGNSRDNLPTQKEAFVKEGNCLSGLCWGTYTRQAKNHLYDALVAVITSFSQAQTADEQSLRKLMALLVPVYDTAIEILSAFLPADLAWQTRNGKDAATLLPKNREEIRQKAEAITRFTNACLPPASVPQEAIDAVTQYLGQSSSCSLFTQLPNHTDKFHTNYVALRDRLFEIVEAIERTQDQKA